MIHLQGRQLQGNDTLRGGNYREMIHLQGRQVQGIDTLSREARMSKLFAPQPLVKGSTLNGKNWEKFSPFRAHSIKVSCRFG